MILKGRRAECVWLGVVVVVAVCLCTTMLGDTKNITERNTENDLLQQLASVSAEHRETRRLVDRLYCRIMKVLPSGGYCLDEKKVFNGGNDLWDGPLCAALEDLFGNASVADFGAGLGHYGRCFLRMKENLIASENPGEQKVMASTYLTEMARGGLTDKAQVVKSWNGYDGAFNIEEVSNGGIHTLNLGTQVDLGRSFDWSMSLEVGEHIPARSEDVFIDNLVRHACRGVVLSWAVPEQGGHHHVNSRPNDYIRSKMASRGLTEDMAAEEQLRARASIGWFKKTLMVFRLPKHRC